MRIYAIGDIHGQLEKLKRAHALITADRERAGDAKAPVVHIGDLCDRGPNTKGVLDFLLDGQAAGAPWLMLKGNHDRMMAWFLDEPPRRDHRMRAQFEWVHPRIGGLETLASYGVDATPGRPVADLHAEAREKVPPRHKAFLDALPTAHHLGDVFLCHAGIRPGVALDNQTEDDLLWIRDEFLTSTADHGPLIVHGHTPVDRVTHYGNRLNIDTGAGYGRALSAVVIEGRDAWLLTDQGRQPVARA